MTQPAAGVSNMILYGVQFTDELDDDAVEDVAKRAIENPGANFTTEEMYAGIVEALASDETLTGLIPGHQHGEQDYRDFLARVVRRLDAMRPWPERPFQPVDPSSLGNLDSARLIARIKLSVIKVEPRLRTVFRQVGDGRRVVALRLKSGAEVVLVAKWWPESKDTALLLPDPHRPSADVMEEFCTATGITRDEIEVAGQ